MILEPIVYGISSYTSNSMKSDNPDSGIYEAKTSRTLELNGGNPACNQGGMIVLEGNGARPSHRGDGYLQSDKMYTLNTIERHGVCYSIGNGQVHDAQQQQIDQEKYVIEEINMDKQEYIVRRLTPLECCRLQGFPDGYAEIDPKEDFTDEEYAFWLDVRNTYAEINGKQTKEYTKEQMLKWYNKLHTDSAEYKMWGNGIGLPNALYVMEGIVDNGTICEDFQKDD